jgi:intraflagellar transport protein 172
VCAAGNDGRVTFYDRDGGQERTFDYADSASCKEFTVASFNNTGDSVVVGNFDSFYTFSYNAKSESWDENELKTVENMCVRLQRPLFLLVLTPALLCPPVPPGTP